jgi:hypothetical protein
MHGDPGCRAWGHRHFRRGSEGCSRSSTAGSRDYCWRERLRREGTDRICRPKRPEGFAATGAIDASAGQRTRRVIGRRHCVASWKGRHRTATEDPWRRANACGCANVGAVAVAIAVATYECRGRFADARRPKRASASSVEFDGARASIAASSAMLRRGCNDWGGMNGE